jgi:hypothetical protein
METLGNENLLKSAPKFYCNFCDYRTSKKSSFTEHKLSLKHARQSQGNVLETLGNENLLKICSQKYTCKKCKRDFKNRSGLWKHNKLCDEIKDDTQENIIINSLNEPTDKDLIMMLIKENSELKNMMMKVIENGVTSNSHNTTHTNSHNKAFNLNFFLNETCKDAMNIGEFVDSLKLQLSDLEKVGEAGYIEGISSIIVKNLKALDITRRPVHCTDKKRETVYIKDADKWEKDEDKTHMHKLVKKVVSQNVKLFAKFREAHPDCKQYNSKYSDQYNKIIYESMGGKGDDDFEKNEKIIKNVLKEVVVDKNI